MLPTDCSDGRPSDTEELLRPNSDELPSMTSPAAPSLPPKSPQSPQLSFEVSYNLYNILGMSISSSICTKSII